MFCVKPLTELLVDSYVTAEEMGSRPSHESEQNDDDHNNQEA